MYSSMVIGGGAVALSHTPCIFQGRYNRNRTRDSLGLLAHCSPVFRFHRELPGGLGTGESGRSEDQAAGGAVPRDPQPGGGPNALLHVSGTSTHLLISVLEILNLFIFAFTPQMSISGGPIGGSLIGQIRWPRGPCQCEA